MLTDRQVSSDVSLSQRLPWGASYEVGWSGLRRSNNSLLNRFQPELNAAATARITQPLLRGFTIDPARADRARSLQARDRAGFELDGTVTALKREVLYAYWQWVYTRRASRLSPSDALALARALLDGNRQRVAARAMAATDVIEAEAEVARRDEAVIVAEKNVANAEDQTAAADTRLLVHRNIERRSSRSTRRSPRRSPRCRSRRRARWRNGATSRSCRSAIETDTLNVRQLRNEALPDVNLSAGFSAQAVGGTELIREAGIGTPVVGSLERGFGLVLGDLGQLRYPGWSMQVSVGYPVGRRCGEGQRRPSTSRKAAD